MAHDIGLVLAVALVQTGQAVTRAEKQTGGIHNLSTESTVHGIHILRPEIDRLAAFNKRDRAGLVKGFQKAQISLVAGSEVVHLPTAEAKLMILCRWKHPGGKMEFSRWIPSGGAPFFKRLRPPSGRQLWRQPGFSG